MKIFEIRILVTLIFTLLMVSSGIWLSRKGKPYNVILFNIHKLISLVAITMMVMTVIFYAKGIAISSEELAAMIATGIISFILLISGGLLNLDREMPKFLLMTHRILPVFLLALGGLTLYLLIG